MRKHLRLFLSRDLSRKVPRQSKKQPWEKRLQQQTGGWRGWGLSEHYGKVRLKLQFPPGAGIANASATLPYSWAEGSIQPVSRLVDQIYEPVMEGGIGEVTNPKPLTFRRHKDIDGHHKMSA